jgi:hypothetical protein
MRFKYLAKSLKRSVHTLGSATHVELPIFSVTLMTATAAHQGEGMVDTACTDVIFPLSVAQSCNLDLTNAPIGEASDAGGNILRFRYAPVRLRISDGNEAFEWATEVGFLNRPGKAHALLGHTGFLNFFDVTLLGSFKEVLITPNNAFQGQVTRRSP